MTKENQKIKLSPKQIFTKFAQFIFLSIKNSNDNILWESAAACSYSFIFSFIPVVLIIFTVLINILKVSPDILQMIIDFCQQFSNVFDVTPFINNLIQKKSLSFINIFLAIWVIWMARKMFLSIVQALNRIFLSATKRVSVVNQLITFISEFVLVIVFILVMIFAFLFNKFLQLPVLATIRSSFPKIFRTSSNVLVSSVLYFLFFIFTLYSYRFMTGSKPKIRISAFYAALSTAVTFIISFFINKFMNFTNYNVIYGTISTMLIMLFKVYMFFVVFLFCAQMLYVSQFFEEQIIAQIYTKNSAADDIFTRLINQKLFRNPSLYRLETENRILQANYQIYTENDKADYVYFVRSGSVVETKDGIPTTYQKGDFFGEIPAFLHTNRESSAVTKSETELMLIKTSRFKEIIRKNQAASAKALERVNNFTRE